MSSESKVENFGKKQPFAKVDFVDFIGRKEFVAKFEITHLIESEVFQEVVNDFVGGVICLEVAAWRMRDVMAEKSTSLNLHQVYMPSIIKWVGYRTQLDPEDRRCIKALTRPSYYYNSERRTDRLAVYAKFIEIVPAHQQKNMWFSLKQTDEQQYLEHWKQAFPDAFEMVMSDHRLLAQLISAQYHGADHVSDIYASAVETFEVGLPFLHFNLRLTLFADLGGLLAQNLVCLDFCPEVDYPEFFTDKDWWTV